MPSEILRAAAVQMSCQDDLAANLSECRASIARAASMGARLVVLPENFAYFGPDEGRRAIAEPAGDSSRPIQHALSTSAREHGVVVVGGGMPEASADPARPFNTLVVFGPDGELAGAYRKVHLFDVDLPDGARLRESDSTSPGGSSALPAPASTAPALVVVDVFGFKVGLSICYDLRFPELYRGLVDRGAEVLLVPAAFTLQTGKDHFHPLLRARAIEAQCYVVAAAQWGKHPRGRATYGHSMVVDPWGTIVAEASDRTCEVVADIDRAYLERVRALIPSLRHRRL